MGRYRFDVGNYLDGATVFPFLTFRLKFSCWVSRTRGREIIIADMHFSPFSRKGEEREKIVAIQMVGIRICASEIRSCAWKSNLCSKQIFKLRRTGFLRGRYIFKFAINIELNVGRVEFNGNDFFSFFFLRSSILLESNERTNVVARVEEQKRKGCREKCRMSPVIAVTGVAKVTSRR